MSAFIECGMHHIFRGVVKDCIVVMNAFMTHHNLYASFERAINPYLQELKRIRLTWCHVKTFPMTLWQAEDELGFSRIQQFVYAVFFTNVFSLPINSNTNEESIMALKMIINALSVMVHGLMTPRDTSTYFIDRHVKVFLSCCHRFCQAYYSDGVTEFWSTTANFPSLLNLAEQVNNHGRLRWYWDGTRERYIQSVKKILKNLRKSPSYFTRKLEMMQKLTVVSWLRVTLPDLDEDDDEMIRNYDESRMYFRYQSYKEIFQLFARKQIISGFTIKGRKQMVFVSFGKRGRGVKDLNVIRICLAHFTKKKEETIGLTYGDCTMDPEDKVFSKFTRENMEKRMENYCVILPFPVETVEEGIDSQDAKRTQKCAIVFDDWDVVNSMGVKDRVDLGGLLFG